MSSRTTPFHQTTVPLGRCTLVPLDPPSIARIAGSLASMDPWKRLGYREPGFRNYLSRPDPGLWRCGISVGPGCEGVVCLRYPWLGGPFLELLALLDGFRGKGLGGDVIGWMEEECRGICANLWTSASSFNDRARAFYRRHGFEEVTLIEDLLRPGDHEMLLRKRIPRPPSAREEEAC